MIVTKGIVIREHKYGDSSKILVIYTEKLGKISVLARGAKSPKYKFSANTQVFCLSEFHLKEGKNFYFIYEADLINANYSIREDIYRLYYGSYVLELIYQGVALEAKNEKLFKMLEKFLEILSQKEGDFLKFIVAYEIKFISFIGYRPYIESCVSCGEEDLGIMKFSLKESGILCNKCFIKDRFAIYIDRQIQIIMNKLLYSSFEDLDDLELEEEDLKKVHSLLVKYILSSIDRKEFKSLKLLETII